MKRLITIFCYFVLSASLFGSEEAVPFDQKYGYELLRYLYRWHMDDSVLTESAVKQDQLHLYYRYLDAELDEGDLSQHLEVVVPLAQMVVLLKRSEYRIPELDLEFKDPYFKVKSVQYEPDAQWDKSTYKEISYNTKETLAYLFRTRNAQTFPGPDALDRLRVEALNVMKAEGGQADLDAVRGELQIAYIAPISIVSNDLWVYWVNGQKFFCFSADVHHSHERFWELATLNVEIIDAKEQVLVLNDIRDAHGYFSKDYIGRILFNCMIHGQQVCYQDGVAVSRSSSGTSVGQTE
jgi:hypothetical protein